MKLVGINFNGKILFRKWKPFSIYFSPQEAVFPYSGNVITNEYFIPGVFFTDISGNYFLKTDLILASGNSFSSWLKPFSSIASGNFQECPHPVQWKHIFQSRRKSIVGYLELLFLLVESITEIMCKPVFFDFFSS